MYKISNVSGVPRWETFRLHQHYFIRPEVFTSDFGQSPQPYNYSGSCPFHLSLTASTSTTPSILAFSTTLLAFPTTGLSIIFPSNAQAPLPALPAFSSATTTRTAHA